MMFLFHVAISMGLLVILFAVCLIVWSMRNEGSGVGLAKTMGIIILLFALFSMGCSTYYALVYWHQGYFKSPMSMMKQ